MKSNNVMKEKILGLTAGRVFFVGDADNTNDVEYRYQMGGASVNYYNTLAEAVGAAVDGRGDTIYVLPGSYTQTASIAINKDDLRIIGLSSDGYGADVSFTGITGVDEVLNVNAQKVLIEGIRINCYSTTGNGIVVSETEDCYYATIRKCTFKNGARQIAASQAQDSPHLMIEDCRFYQATTASADVNASYAIIKNCLFATLGTATADIVHIGRNNGSVSRDNMSIIDTVILGISATDGIDVDGGSNCTIMGTRVTGATNELTDGGTNTEAIGSYKDTFTDANGAQTYIQAAIKP